MAAKRKPIKSDGRKKPKVPKSCGKCRKKPNAAGVGPDCTNFNDCLKLALTNCNVGDRLVVGPNGTIVCEAP